MIQKLSLTILVALSLTAQAVETRTANNGNLVMEDIPEIPTEVVADLNRYQNVRSAGFSEWSKDGDSIYITTRFGDVAQLHRVDQPGGARQQMTFFNEPLGGVSRQPGGDDMLFLMDAGGNEFSQLFLLDSGSGEAQLISDGQSRNGAALWSRDGNQVAFQSTRRNGASNDIWIMDPSNPETARMILPAPDGTWWGPVDFDQDNEQVLVINYVSINDSRIHLLNAQSGEIRRVRGGGDNPGSNQPLGFDADGNGIWLTTDQSSQFTQLAWQSLTDDRLEIITADIPWNVEGMTMSEDRKRAAFTVNIEGQSQLYFARSTTPYLSPSRRLTYRRYWRAKLQPGRQ